MDVKSCALLNLDVFWVCCQFILQPFYCQGKISQRALLFGLDVSHSLSEHGCKQKKIGNVCIHVTLRRVRVTIVAVEKQSITYSECVCSLSYPAYSAHAPLLYCHMWPVWLYHIFHIIS
jgi:hypothetical protein